MGHYDPKEPLDGVYYADNGDVYSPMHTHNSGDWGFDIHHTDGSKTHVNYLDEEINQYSTEYQERM